MKFWCGTAFMNTSELPELARMLDEAGYHGLLVGDHVIYPKEFSQPAPYASRPDGRPLWDPETPFPHSWVLIGALAAVTKRLHFSNAVYIAPARPLLEVAKQVSTASVLSGGRVSLGVGAGWMREEFELLGQDFDNRGPRLNEMIQALRELWKGGWVEWHGEHYDIPPLMMEPHPEIVPPIICGGHSGPALRRAAKYCDGWIGIGYTWDDAAHYISKLRSYLAECGRDKDDFEIMIALADPPHVDLYRRAEEELGVTSMMCQPWPGPDDVAWGQNDPLSQSTERFREPIQRFAEEIVNKFS
jgi:probable F420-dependent oxidoreductase